jgi:FKBP-type peptidyl-prolyl cis-trans isomerase
MKQFLRPTLTAAAMAVALGMTAGVSAKAATAAATGTVDKAKASYIVGYQMAGQVPEVMRTELDPAAVARAVQAALSGQKPTMTPEEAKTVMEPFIARVQAKEKAEMAKMAATNKAQGDAFLAKNKTVAGVKTTASGLQYQMITAGSGARPSPSDTATINYTGSLINGEVFDASSKHNPPGPASIPLANVIPGFKEGLELMQPGAHYKLFIPASLGYGEEGRPGIPPNATLIFDVTMVKVGPTPAGAAAAPGQGAGG